MLQGPASTVVPGVALGGERDARVFAHALADWRFAPVRDLLERLDRWCRDTAPRYAATIAPGVLAATNARLFGPVVAECFVACAAGPAGPDGPAGQLVDRRGQQCQAFLDLFLARLDRDRAGGYWPADPELAGPVTGLRAHDEESHNGGQRVLQLALAGGGRVAYKPRPASGETLFLSPGTSLFALLNRLPPETGPVRLPELRSWTGPVPDQGPGFAGYSWQEWVEPPTVRGVLRTEDGWQLAGTVLAPPQAEQFWRNAGALAAACYGLGVTDLHGGNLLVGARPGEDEPLMYPVDLEVYLAGVTRLSDTHLIHDPAVPGTHHVGLENAARWCTLAGPPAVFWRGPDGDLELHWRTAPFGRTQTRSVVADSTGRSGYGPYLAAMLRGMFDGWTLLSRHRTTVRGFLEAHCARHTVRVLPRATASYQAALPHQRGEAGREWQPDAGGLAPAEQEQLARGDVPYFFRAGSGGPLLAAPPPPEPFRTVAVALAGDPDRTWPPRPVAVAAERLTLSGLGPALRDAVSYVFDDVPELQADDPDHRVRLHLQAPGAGQVSFDLPERDRRITYRWRGATIRIRIDPLSAPVPDGSPPDAAGAIRHRLLRLDRVDRVLRTRWTASSFTDPVLAEQLRRLTSTGLAWLQTVVGRHGWPGRALVGGAAAAAASRLVQHGEGQLGFRRHCLELVRRAAAAGDMPARDIAYLTDALRLAEDRSQWYGTKFAQVGDTLQPCPIEAPEEVDARRAALGMEPLAWYARRVRAAFPLTPDRPATDPETAPG